MISLNVYNITGEPSKIILINDSKRGDSPLPFGIRIVFMECWLDRICIGVLVNVRNIANLKIFQFFKIILKSLNVYNITGEPPKISRYGLNCPA